MWKFLAGALVVFLFYNHANVKRLYHKAMNTINKPRVLKPLEGPPRPLKTKVDVHEPTLDQLEALGFNVRREE